MNIQVKRGDVFGTKNPMWLGKAINGLQWFWSKDGESKYSHSGIIIDDQGTTFEALWTVSSKNLFDEHKGDNLIIARPNSPINGRPFDIEKALKRVIKEHNGQWYPGWRLLLHTIPPLAKIALFDRLVCSELVAQYLYLAGTREGQYKGTNPDTLADEWRRWKNFDIVFEGKL